METLVVLLLIVLGNAAFGLLLWALIEGARRLGMWSEHRLRLARLRQARAEAEAEAERAGQAGGGRGVELPAYVDLEDPASVEAWRRAEVELRSPGSVRRPSLGVEGPGS